MRSDIDLGVEGLGEGTKSAVAAHAAARAGEASAKRDFDARRKWGGDSSELLFEERREKFMALTQARFAPRHAVAVVLVALVARRTGLLELLWRFKLIVGAVFGVHIYTAFGAPRVINPTLNPTPQVPFLGSLPYVLKHGLQDMLTFSLNESISHNFTGAEDTAFGPTRTLMIEDEADRRYVLKDNWGNFTKNTPTASGTFEDILTELLGRGIFITDEEEWRDHRKIASHMFSVNGLRTQMERVFVEHADELVALLRTEVGSARTLDFQEIMQGFTFDTICEIAFGHSPNACASSFHGAKPRFLVAFDGMQQIASERFARVWFPITRFFDVGVEKEFSQHAIVVNDYVNGLIAERRADGDFATRSDLLSLYIQHARASNAPHLESTEYLRDVIVNFMVAGRDTTSSTMTTMFRYLSQSPETVEKMREEFTHTVDTTPNWENMQKCRFCVAVINESLRMLPPVGVDFRFSREDDILPTGLIVPANTVVGISNISIARNPKYWHYPYEWKPERWYVSTDKVRTRPDEYMFPVFWGGPRLCLGKDMARFELSVIAHALLTARDLEIKITMPSPTTNVVYQNGLVAFIKEVDGFAVPCEVVARRS